MTTRPVISNPDVAGTCRAWGRTRWWPGNGGDGDGRRGVMVVAKLLLLAVETGVVVVGFTRGRSLARGEKEGGGAHTTPAADA